MGRWEHELKAAQDVDWTALDLVSDKDHVAKQVCARGPKPEALSH